jgi:hypothetical protein
MDRRQIAFLLIAVLVVALAAIIARARYRSHTMVLRRRQRSDEKRYASRRADQDGSL